LTRCQDTEVSRGCSETPSSKNTTSCDPQVAAGGAAAHGSKSKVPERTGTLLTFIGPNELGCATLTVHVFVFFVLSLSTLLLLTLLTLLSALLSALTSLTGLALLTGLSATLAGLSALLSLLAILFHIVCHQ